MKASWALFEDKVRHIAQLIWNKPAMPEKIGNVDVDAVIRMDPQLAILIEITEERKLDKVRGDVIKLTTAQNALYARRVIARSYCVVDADTLTEGMRGAGKESSIVVMTIKEFSQQFFDFDKYSLNRMQVPFGSAIDPLTGAKDDSEYVPVRYLVDSSTEELGTAEIAKLLRDGRHIVLLGEYGSGKSRCIRELFRYLSERASQDFCHPLAIDLRESWGLRRGTELVRRHLDDLGLETLSNNAIRAMNAGAVAMLLDGFDELGSQAWNNDPARLRTIRAQALQGVKDVIRRSNAGVLVAGREHYFPSNEEMFKALGIDGDRCVVIRSKQEFSDEELQEFFDQRGIDIEIPLWLPRRPLICQTINNLPEADRDKMFDENSSETAFWNHFKRVLCLRDARIHVSFDPDTIYGVLKRLGRFTRTRAANVGPVTLTDMQKAFEDVVGQPPGEEASVMLQRLPSLGRLSREADDRQFTDTYVLDGLRAKDVGDLALTSHDIVRDVLAAAWGNGLDALGQRILASDAVCSDSKLMELAREAASSGNTVLASDAIASLVNRSASKLDFGGLRLRGGHFVNFNLSRREFANLTLQDCTFGTVHFGGRDLIGVSIQNCLAERVIGASSHRGLPEWAQLRSDKYESVENTASIKRIGLKPAQQILATTVRKTFFQKGAARKEEALTRGFARIGNPSLISKVLNLLISEGVLETSRGHEGTLYIPVRKQTGRMQQLMAELSTSHDPLWHAVSEM